MGMYLVSVGAQDWFGQEEGGYEDVASGLNEELGRRGLPPYEPSDSGPEPQGWFEEKMSAPMAGFDVLCRAHMTDAEQETLLGWTVLVPLALEQTILLPVGSAYADETVVAGAPQVLALAERLAGVIGLPPDAIPATGGNLELSLWFMEDEARKAAAARPGPWADDLDAAFYVALYLRAAQYSLRHGCAMTYS